MVRRMLVIAALGAGMLGLTACDLARNTAEDDATIDTKITSVRVNNDSGYVKIKTGDRTTVHRKVRYDSDKPGATHRVEGDVLIVEPCNVRSCAIDYDLVVPSGTVVDSAVDSGSTEVDGVATANIRASSGGVTVRRVSGQVNVNSSSGPVRVSDIGAAVTVVAESGRVSVENVRANVNVQADSGMIEARGIGGAVDLRADSGAIVATLTSPQNVRAHADSGAVNITVPRAAYRVTTSTDSGSVRGDVTNDSSGTHELNVQTDSGSIALTYS